MHRTTTPLLGVLAAASLVLAPTAAQAQGQTLWYNGNLFGQGGLRNQIGGGSTARIFDDFAVTDPGGWTVTGLWTNTYFLSGFFGGPPNVTQADWSIRTGVSAGSGGTVLYSGVSPVSRTATGRAPNFLYSEYTLRVSGLSLDLAPGTYWLNVTPLFGGDAFASPTRGSGAVGLPAGNNGSAFFDRPNAPFVAQTSDFSLGVAGTVRATSEAIPEPGSLALALPGLLALAGAASRSRRRTF